MEHTEKVFFLETKALFSVQLGLNRLNLFCKAYLYVLLHSSHQKTLDEHHN